MGQIVTMPDRAATAGDMARIGRALGVQTAERILRGYGLNVLQPDPSIAAVIGHAHGIMERYVADQRLTNGMTDVGEAAYRRGFSEGLAVTLKGAR